MTAVKPIVEIENKVYEHLPADNGSGPMWCQGNTCIARLGSRVFASGIETLPSESPLNNVVPMLFSLNEDHWELAYKADPSERTREPSPLGIFPDGRLWLSVNPTLTVSGTYAGPAEPRLLEFAAEKPFLKPHHHWPQWFEKPAFNQHSYRSFAVDGPNREMILFQNQGYTHAAWTFCDRQGNWSAQGNLIWPYGHEYDQPQPVRICYPSVQVSNRAVHFCGVSDITEPYNDWRAFKKELTGQDWDYDFRRLFYTWSEDITQDGFRPWVEIASRDRTCGWINPRDLYLDPQGIAHILWYEKAIDERLREKYFPTEKQFITLNYARLFDGQIKMRVKVVQWHEGDGGGQPAWGRFQITPSGRLLLIYSLEKELEKGEKIVENRVVEIAPDGSLGEHITIPLRKPFSAFFTAGIRGGSVPSNTLDMLGTTGTNTISYARIAFVKN